MKWTQLFIKFKWKFVLTACLILAEIGLSILFPLFIGIAIDDAIHGAYQGAVLLGGLGFLSLIIGMSRRVFDSRLYAKIFEQTGAQTMQRMPNSSPSVKAARLDMLKEVVEFMEHSLPEIVGNVVSLLGVVIIIAFLSIKIFIGALCTLGLVFLIYLLSSKQTLYFNKVYNNALERQVDVVASQDAVKLSKHLRQIMKWNIKLSDLEAINFSLSWLVLIVFLVASIILSIQDGIVQYGALFALIMYVFELIENIINLPFYYQQWLRLAEISDRLAGVETSKAL
jgi:ABC-type multidrug transport system fused ATPase/permease subunit